jgi:hypothetical protein
VLLRIVQAVSSLLYARGVEKTPHLTVSIIIISLTYQLYITVPPGVVRAIGKYLVIN